MTTPIISVISSAARPENWPGIYKNISDGVVPFEIIFVGPNEPVEQLPDNVRYIKANVKPAQVWEIASRHAQGSVLLWTADDILFLNDNPLDQMYSVYLAHADLDVIVSSEYQRDVGWNHLAFGSNLLEMPLNGMISTKLWRQLGGLDRRFIAVGWEIDLTLRLLSIGGKVVMSKVYIGDEIEAWPFPRSRGGSLLREYGGNDGKLMDDLWKVDGIYVLDRQMPFESFPESTILTRSEHPQGRWRYENNFINKFITSKTFYSLRRIRRVIRGRAQRFKYRNIPSYVRRFFS